jgi:tubulin beta
MVREIVHCQVGQCGNQIGNAFWERMAEEHMIRKGDGSFEGDKADPSQALLIDKINVYFKQAGNSRYVARSVCIDLEPGTSEVIKASAIGGLFKTDNFIFGASGAGNNWAKGHYTEGAEVIDEVLDVVRREAEGCDCPQGFQITHSLGGGTGSGLGTLLLLKIRDAYPDRITATFSVYPSPKVSDVVVEPYNATLSINQCLENSDETFVIDNEALFNISHNVLQQPSPKFPQLNYVISLVMSGVTSSLRFPGKLNGDLRKMGVNLVPFPRLHFFLIAQAPLFSPDNVTKVKLNVKELNDQCWSARNFLANVRPEDGKYLAASLVFRGNLQTEEVDDQMAQTQSKLADSFVNWIPNNIKSTIVKVPPPDVEMSGTFVANTTALKGIFQRIATQFAKMYKRKAFLHWYSGEGMDEMEFQEADKNVRDLVTEYQDKEDAVVDADNDGYADDDGMGGGDEAYGDEDGDEF